MEHTRAPPAERLHRMLVSFAWAACDPIADLEAADLERGITPDAVLDSVADLPRWWPAPREHNV